MANFYGVLKGSRGEATRTGTKKSGMHATLASWGGSIRVYLHEAEGVTLADIYLEPWEGSGVSRFLMAVNVETGKVVYKNEK